MKRIVLALTLKVCDRTYAIGDNNGKWAVGRAYNNETDAYLKAVGMGPGDFCGVNWTQKNREWHQTGVYDQSRYGLNVDWSHAEWNGPISYHR